MSKHSNATASNRPKTRINVEAKTKRQKEYILKIKENEITICSGPAGTGKTAVAVGIGLQHVSEDNSPFERLVVLRPVREACGEHLGYLPGDLQEKMAPWAAPVLDNMRVFISENQTRNLLSCYRVEIVPLALARGRSFNHSFIILDEAQNCSSEQMLMVLTRLGEGSKMVIAGDVTQRDVEAEGLSDAIERLHDMKGVGIVEFEVGDVVRNPMITEIINRYSYPNDE